MNYPGTGRLGSAIKDFKSLVRRGDHKSWPEFWRDFAEQAFADLIALEVELEEAVETISIVAFGKGEGPYSMMHRRRLCREFVKARKGKRK